MFGWLPGADLQSVVNREVADLNATRTGSADRTGAFNWQDHVGAWMAGSNKEEVLRLAMEKANKDLLQQVQPQIDRNNAALGHLAPQFQGVEGKTEKEILAQLGIDQKRGEALEQVTASNPHLDVGTIGANASAATILGQSTKATQAYNKGEANRAEDKADKRYDDSQKVLALQMQQQMAATEADREDRRAQNRLANKRLDLQEARASRRDRQAAIQQMMAGLAQMGASIAI